MIKKIGGVNFLNKIRTKYHCGIFAHGSTNTKYYSKLPFLTLSLFYIFFNLLSTDSSNHWWHQDSRILNTNSYNIASALELTKSVSNPSPISGETFYYTLQYRCAGLTEDCLGTVITDPLPADLEFVNVIGSVHTTSESYDAGTHTVTFSFVDPLISGSLGEVRIEVRFPNGTTPNGTISNNEATISASNATSVVSSATATSVAGDTVNISKDLLSGGAVDGYASYHLMICNGDAEIQENGNLNLDNITIVDTLPPGSIFIEYNLNNGSSATYDTASHSITITHPSLASGECIFPKVTVEYPSPIFSLGDTVSNEAFWSYTPVGESLQTVSDIETIELVAPSYVGQTLKTLGNTTLFSGESSTYTIWAGITGTEPANQFCINDTIPSEIEITSFSLGGWYYGGLSGPENILSISYTTNLNGPTLLTGSPRSIWDDDVIDVATDLGLTIGGGEYITSLNYCFGDVPAGFDNYSNIQLGFTVRSNTSAGVVTNCAELSTTSPGFNLIDNCADLTVNANTGLAKLNPVKSVVPNAAHDRGDTISFQIAIRNELGASDSILNPVAYDLLAEGLSYIPGSWYLPSWGNLSGYPLPDFTIISDYKGTGREFLKWEWGAGIQIPSGDRVVIEFQTEINNEAVGGTPAFYNYSYIDVENTVDCQTSFEDADVFDFDDDGNTSEMFCGNRRAVNINELLALESEKLVKGQLDTAYTKFPDIANSVPGGIADYILEIRNVGNIPLDSVIVIDILPAVGDLGVIDVINRDSRWQPNLVSSVNAPAGVTVFYSTAANPCRDNEGFVPTGPVGCDVPNWSTSIPVDLTTVRSLKFEFGSTILQPMDTIQLAWAMRVPVNILATIGAQADSIAWNSFGFLGRRTDNSQYTLPSEPVKVGVKLEEVLPNGYGDFVWEDTNQNGIQDPGEPGINGIRVELFKDNGDGIIDLTVDTFINFTLTANGGFYLFPDLDEGDFYSVFHKPPDMDVSINDAGGDDNFDSDGVLGTYNGFDVAISPIATLTDFTFDYSWDLGLYPSSTGSIGDYVWNDVNLNGIQDESNSEGINGITIYLHDIGGTTSPIDSVVSSNDPNGNPGYYQFTGITPGLHYLELSLPSGLNYTSQGSTGSSDSSDSDFNSISNFTELFNVIAGEFNNSWDAGLILPAAELCDNNFDDDGDNLVDCNDPDCSCLVISGSVFEDINFGGGEGRSASIANSSAVISGWPSNSIYVENARVELYDNFGNFVTSTNTDANGAYSFSFLGSEEYSIRVVNSSVSSNRLSNNTFQTTIPVQTFRTDGVTDVVNEVGGASPALVDANDNLTSANISSLTTATTIAQTVTTLTLAGSDQANIDFGFNYDVVVNTNDAGQGSLRQFILNSNEFDNTNLNQEDNPTGGVSFPKDAEWETSILMIPGIEPHEIIPLTALPSIRDAKTHITGYTQVGSAQGPIATRTINVELFGNAANFEGINIYTNDVQVSGLSINSFRRGIYSNLSNTVNSFVWGNYIGAKADGITSGANSNIGIQYLNIESSFIGTNGDNLNDANEGNIVVQSYSGIALDSSEDILVAGNYIGVDKTGTGDLGNQFIGIVVSSASSINTIGFDDSKPNTTAGDFRNVISGNGTDGIRLSSSDDQKISGNYIGTDASGMALIPNSNYGIQIQGILDSLTIGTNSNGDDDILERNIISGNGSGIRFIGSCITSNTKVAGNFIGTDISGNSALPNQANGLNLVGLHTGLVIGTNGDNINDAVEVNVISGNNNDGIRVDLNNAIIAGNHIGVGYDGVTAVPNGQRGILIATSSSSNTIGYSTTMANSDALVVGNKIMFNADSGIGLSGSGDENRISRNQIANNLSLGIDLGYDLVSPNDDGDSDFGSNDFLNFPVLISAEMFGSNLIISGFAPAGSTIEFFIPDGEANPNPLPGGYTSSFGEGASYLFSFVEGSGADADVSTGSYTDDGTGAVSTKTQSRFEFTIDVTGLSLSTGMDLTSTATDTSNNTSEFSGWTNIILGETCDAKAPVLQKK